MYRYVSFVAACCVPPSYLHALVCTVNADDSAVFRFLSLVTLTFDLRTREGFLYNVPNRQVWSSYV